jgi:hypothetical protein
MTAVYEKGYRKTLSDNNVTCTPCMYSMALNGLNRYVVIYVIPLTFNKLLDIPIKNVVT